MLLHGFCTSRATICSSLISLPPYPGCWQLAGAIRHRHAVQRRAWQRGQGSGRQGACLLLPRLQHSPGKGAGCWGRACGEDAGSHPAWSCQGKPRWGSSQIHKHRSVHVLATIHTQRWRLYKMELQKYITLTNNWLANGWPTPHWAYNNRFDHCRHPHHSPDLSPPFYVTHMQNVG